MASLFPLLVAGSLGLGLAYGYMGLAVPGGLEWPLLLALVAASGFLVGLGLDAGGGGLGGAALLGVAYGLLVLATGALAGFLLAGPLGVEPGITAATGAAGGWYSLAGPMVSAVDPAWGLAALVANIAREALHIALYPVLAGRGLRVEAVVLGGATTMDTGLPVVVLHGGPRASAVAVAQGVTVTLLAPAVLAWLLGL